jgi:hypothetical protein
MKDKVMFLVQLLQEAKYEREAYEIVGKIDEALDELIASLSAKK